MPPRQSNPTEPEGSSLNAGLDVLVSLLVTLLMFGAAAPGGAQPMVVIPFGDSITHGLGDGSVTCQQAPRGYPIRLRGSLNSRGLSTEMRIRAVCGEETGGGVTRIQGVLADNPEARLVLIMEGTNDLSKSQIGPESVMKNIKLMAESVLDAGMQPVVASLIPRAPEGGSNFDTRVLHDLLKDLTTEMDIEFVDQFRLVNIDNLYDTFYWDPLHPNARGYDLVADNWIEPTLAAAQRPIEVEPCEPGDQTLCLNDERFQVEVEWEDFDGNTGVGQAVPLTSDTGYFWFFGKDNIELVVKALDGRGFNDRYWIFYGALSTVEYRMTVIDTFTGRRKVYFNPARNLASVGDTDAFPGDSPGAEDADSSGAVIFETSQITDVSLVDALEARPALSKRVIRPADPENHLKVPCEESAEVICLLDNRFAIKMRWEDYDQRTGTGKGVKLTSDSGYFWFFADTNVEVMIKVLDGRGFNDHYWVFYGALSSVEYEIEVTDTETGETAVYFNPLNNFGSEADTFAFAADPGSQ